MSKVIWDAVGEREFEAGVDRGVLYPSLNFGVAWNGLVAVHESDDETTQTVTYFDGQVLSNRMTLSSFAATIDAFTYPAEFEPFDGSDEILTAQKRETFGFSYRTMLGNDISQEGYRVHLVYNALATPSARHYASIDPSNSTTAMSWDISTTPVPFSVSPLSSYTLRPSAHLILDSTVVAPGVMAEIESILYGEDLVNPRLPLPTEILDIFEPYALFRIFDHGDGTFTATGPDDAVYLTAPTEFVLSWPSVVMLSEDTYKASSF
jgi:hypothetical protein